MPDDPQGHDEPGHDEPGHDEQGHGKWQQRYLHYRSGPLGQPRADLWRQGLLDFVQLDVDAGVLWSSIGPAPLNVGPDAVIYQGIGPDSGEVTDIAIDPSGASDQTIYIATNDGGVWITNDGGGSWRPSMESALSLSMGAVAIDPANPSIVYAGSGNFYDGGYAFTKGVGVYRSSDAGATWSIVDGGPFATIFAGLSITRIIVTASGVLFVATNRGLYRSTDSGGSFQSVLSGIISDLLLDIANPTNLYACVVGAGIFRSIDSGLSFPVNLFANLGAPPQPFGNIELAQNGQVLLALVQLNPGNNAKAGLYRSTNLGAQWAPFSDIATVAAADGFKQTDYDLTVAIDPQNPQLVYAGFQELWNSTDGGAAFQPAACTSSKVHWDIHAFVFSPPAHRTGAPTPIYLGTDGGIAKSADGGATWSAINGQIGTNLLRGIDIGKGAGNNAYTYGGCQDTGTSGHRPADPGTSWYEGIDGDGYFVAVDPTDPTIVYGFDDEEFIKSTDAGVTWDASEDNPPVIGIGLPNPIDDFSRAVALEQRGTDAVNRVVYVAVTTDLYKSTDAGLHFGPSILHVNGDITAVTTTAADSGYVWAGAADGSVHFSADGGANWDQGAFQTQPGGLGAATGIAVDPTNPSRVAAVYAGVSGIHPKYRTMRVFLTTDRGIHWKDISGVDGAGPAGNLPDLPMHAAVFDTSAAPPAIIVASDGGVMRSTDGSTWKIYGAGLPNVCCNSLAIDNTVQPPVLRVGTYGRSCFEATRPAGAAMTVEANLAFGAVPVGQSATLSIYVYNSGNAPLTVTAINRRSGSAVFSVSAAAAFPATVPPGGTQAFDFVFTPSNSGDAAEVFDILSNAAATAVSASGRGIAPPFAPRLACNPGQIGFGTASRAAPRSIPVQLFNAGGAALHISAIDFTGGSTDISLALAPAPAYPIVIAPGAQAAVTFQYQPAQNGAATATFNIVSDDPRSPFAINATGNSA